MNNSFLNITDQNKQKKFIDKGVLVPIYLVGLDFGGSNASDNIAYVTKNAQKTKEEIDNKLKMYMKTGNKVNFRCNLKYEGDSIVPSKIIINYTLNDINNYNEEILVWSNNTNTIDINTTKSKEKSKNALNLILFGLVTLILNALFIYKMISEGDYKYIIIIIIMFLGAFITLVPGIRGIMINKKKHLKRNSLIKIIEEDPCFKEKVKLPHISCSLEYLKKELNSYKYKEDKRFLSCSNLEHLKRELTEKLDKLEIYDAMAILEKIIRGENHKFTQQDISTNSNYNNLLRELDKYYEEGYICQQEKNFILNTIDEMILKI